MIKNKNVETNFELVFKLVYFAFALISFNAFCARQFYISYISYAVVILGAAVLINRITHLRDYLNTNVYLLMAFVVSYGISSLTVLRYGVMENIQGMIWMGLQYFAIFAFDVTRDKELVKKEFNIILSFFLIYTFVMAIAGLVMMFVGFGFYKILDVKYIIAGGFMWNRLYGCYMDPNYGAVFCISSILASLYFLNTTKSKWLKATLIINIIAEYWHIACSDSRTGLVAIFAAFLVFTYLASNKKGKSTIVSVVLAIIIAVSLAGGAVIFQKGTSFAIAKMSSVRMAISGYSEEEINRKLEEERIGRLDEEINEGDISNNRFAIWKSGLDIFAEHPITGISFRNIIEFVDGEKPDSFISKSGFESMHNSFVDILVSQGIIGMLIIIALIVSVFTSLFKNHKYIQDEDYGRFLLAFSCIAGIFAEMMFYSETFYMNTGSAFMFWYFLGYIFNYLIPNSKGETT